MLRILKIANKLRMDVNHMSLKKSKEVKPIELDKLKPEELLKYEIAQELGLFDKIQSQGWGSLSAKETGKIGGLITKKKREDNKKVIHDIDKNINEDIM